MAKAFAKASLGILLIASTVNASPTDPFEAGMLTLDSPVPKANKFEIGDYGVSERTGAASFTIPLPVPPGRVGMAPSISLAYSSQSPLRGGVAQGWELELPSVRTLRDPEDVITPLRHSAVSSELDEGIRSGG